MSTQLHPQTANIVITTPPTKTTYVEGQSFDPTGMVVTLVDGEDTEVISDYTYSPSGALATTDTKITVSYEGMTADVSVSVIEKAVESIVITSQPSGTVYIVGDEFDPTGMEVTAYYNDETHAVVDGYTYSPTGALSAEDTTITVSYEGKTATVAITVTEDQSNE